MVLDGVGNTQLFTVGGGADVTFAGLDFVNGRVETSSEHAYGGCIIVQNSNIKLGDSNFENCVARTDYVRYCND